MTAIGKISKEGREAFVKGKLSRLGELMNEDQALLESLGVSSPELNHLNDTALKSGALGAKLTGGGRGGCILALIEADRRDSIEDALIAAGSRQTFYFEIGSKNA